MFAVIAKIVMLLVLKMKELLENGLTVRQATMAESKKTVAAETQDRPTAPAETLSELDKLVIGFIDGDLDVATLNSLDMILYLHLMKDEKRINMYLKFSVAKMEKCTNMRLYMIAKK